MHSSPVFKIVQMPYRASTTKHFYLPKPQLFTGPKFVLFINIFTWSCSKEILEKEFRNMIRKIQCFTSEGCIFWSLKWGLLVIRNCCILVSLVIVLNILLPYKSFCTILYLVSFNRKLLNKAEVVARRKCQGLQQCNMKVSMSWTNFGNPCPNTKKYLEVTYHCEGGHEYLFLF